MYRPNAKWSNIYRHFLINAIVNEYQQHKHLTNGVQKLLYQSPNERLFIIYFEFLRDEHMSSVVLKF